MISFNSITTLPLSLLTALFAAYVVHLVLQWRRLSHIPGPFSAGFSKFWLVREALRARQPFAFKEANETYGETHIG